MTEIRDQVDDAITVEGGADADQAKKVLRNPKFLALFGSQIFTQVGGNMVLFGLTVTVFSLTNSNTSVSILLLTFLVPAVIFGAIAGVFVDMFDRRKILIWTNFARGALFLLLVFFPDQLIVIYIVTALVATPPAQVSAAVSDPSMAAIPSTAHSPAGLTAIKPSPNDPPRTMPSTATPDADAVLPTQG